MRWVWEGVKNSAKEVFHPQVLMITFTIYAGIILGAWLAR